MKANEIKQVFVLNTVGSSGEREAVIAEKATWTLPVPGASERFIEIKGRMTNQATAHLWLDGKDIESRGDKREKRYSQELWKQYWEKHPVRIYKVPASSLAYVEEIPDLNMLKELIEGGNDAAGETVGDEGNKVAKVA